jgi:hypothetical protein
MTPKVSVYRFNRRDMETAERVRAPRFATLEAIRRVQGEPILDSDRQVDRRDIDNDGLYPKRNVWLVDIFDVVSREDGDRRVSVPHGEYIMREVSAELYSLSGDKLLLPFVLSLTEVATYLPGEGRPGKMKIIAGTSWP